MTRRLEPRAESRALLAIALPLAGAYLAEHAIIFTDRVIVGRLGSLELAAVGLAGMLLFDLLFASMGVLTIVGVMVAQGVAVGDRASASRAVRQGFWVATALSAPVMAACWLLAPLLGRTGQDPRLVPLAEAYLHAVVWAVPPTLWFAVLRNFVTALARTRIVLVVVVGTIGLNAVLNYALVFGRLGAPALGVAGAGYGTAIVSWGMFAALALYAARATAARRFRVHRGLLRLEPRRIREIVRLGLPVAGANVLESGMFTMVAVLIGIIGAAVLAAHQIVVSFIAMGIVVVFAIGVAGGALLAFPLGLGGAGLWVGIAAGLATTAVLLLRRFHIRTRPLGDASPPGATTRGQAPLLRRRGAYCRSTRRVEQCSCRTSQASPGLR